MSEPREIRIKRLKMRSMRRGIKEMDLILQGFCERHVADMDAADLDLYEALLNENDQDLYQWVSGQQPPPEDYADLVTAIKSDLPKMKA